MTIAIDPVLATALAAAGTEDNPVICWENLGASAVTGWGTEVSAAANALSAATYNFWSATPDGSNKASIEITLSAAAAIDFVGVAAHNLADIGASINVQYSTDAKASWNNVPGGSLAPTTNTALAWRFEAITAADFRLRISNVTQDVVLGVVLVGQEILVERRLYQGYAPPLTPNRVELLSNISEGGHFLGNSAVRQGSTVTAALSHVTPEFFRGAAWLGFQAAFNAGAPAFWAWRPDKYADLFYAQRDAGSGPVAPVNSGPRDLMSVNIPMRLLHDEAVS